MRTIKFRGKSILVNNIWFYGDLIHSADKKKTFIVLNEVLPETVGQFTGLYDCEGKEIFEGDILDFNGFKVEVRFVRGMFAFLVNGNLDDELCGDCRTDLFAKVIGNVYENPDILKGGKK